MLVITLVAGSSPVAAAGNKTRWLRVSTPQFTVITSVSEKDAIAWTGEFAQFVAALHSLIPVDPTRLPRLTLMVFADEREFARYRPLGADGKSQDVAGYFSRRDSWAVAGLARAGWRDETRTTIFHEGTHWFLSAFEGAHPVWLEEGLAEVFSTFELKKKHVAWGRAIEHHVVTLNQLRPMPVEELLFITKGQLFTGGSEGMFRTGMAYAQSWAFVHYLIFGDNDLPPNAMMNYVRLLRGAMHPDEAFRQAFGSDYAAVDRKLREYLRRGRYYVGQRPPADLPELRAEPASAAEVEEALARLSVVTGRTDQALAHIEKMREAGEENPVVFELLGQVQQESGNEEAALSAYEEAVRRKSRDFRPYFEVAHARHAGAVQSDGSLRHLSEEEARKVANDYERAINLNPHFQPAYHGLAGVIELVPAGNPHDAEFLELGHRMFPDDGMIALGLAVLAKRSGEDAKAAELLAKVLDPETFQPMHVRRYAMRLETNWVATDIFDKSKELVDTGKHYEALALIEEQLARDNTKELQRRLLNARRMVEGAKQVKEVKEAFDSRDWKEARRLLNEILESDAPMSVKNQMRRRLAELDRRNLGVE